MSEESKEPKLDPTSILIELFASLNERLEKLEKEVHKNKELSIDVDTNYSSKIPDGRSPSLSSIGLVIKEEEIPGHDEDIVKEKIRKCVSMILETAPEYVMNK